MKPQTSLAERVAWGAALAASVSALVAASATSLLAAYLLQRADDRRLEEASATFVYELDRTPPTDEAITAIYLHESQEMDHTGMVFAIYDATGARLRGYEHLQAPTSVGCVTQSNGLRVCSALTKRGLFAVTASAQSSVAPPPVGAAVVAAILAAIFAWYASRPISRRVIAPLSRLREQIAKLDIDTIASASETRVARAAHSTSSTPTPIQVLGPAEHILEVDALRDTIHELMHHVERALLQAHRFAANAAHELRTPLTSVLAELELLAERIAEGPLRTDLQRARRSLSDLALLVERLLVLSLPHRSSTSANGLVSLRDLLEDSLASLPHVDRERVVLTDADALVSGDSILLGTLVANALSNALKFGQHVRTTISTVDGHAILRIDDDGPGLDAMDRDHVFEPFFRAPNALRRRLPGHGLGLALVRHIAQTHGGTAAFADKDGRGALLEVRLPVHGA